MKIRPVGAKMFHADRRTDIKKLIVAFRNFANEPNNSCCKSVNTATPYRSYLHLNHLLRIKK